MNPQVTEIPDGFRHMPGKSRKTTALKTAWGPGNRKVNMSQVLGAPGRCQGILKVSF
jgi:hypothetical protein